MNSCRLPHSPVCNSQLPVLIPLKETLLMDFDIVLDVVPELIIFDVLDYPRARRTYLDLFTCFFIT